MQALRPAGSLEAAGLRKHRSEILLCSSHFPYVWGLSCYGALYATNSNDFLGSEICMPIAFELENGRKTCVPIFPEGEIRAGEDKPVDFIVLWKSQILPRPSITIQRQRKISLFAPVWVLLTPVGMKNGTETKEITWVGLLDEEGKACLIKAQFNYCYNLRQWCAVQWDGSVIGLCLVGQQLISNCWAGVGKARLTQE